MSLWCRQAGVVAMQFEFSRASVVKLKKIGAGRGCICFVHPTNAFAIEFRTSLLVVPADLASEVDFACDV